MKNLGKKVASDFIVGQKVSGPVIKVEPFGAFVEIGGDRPAFLHKTQIMHNQFVRDASTVIKEGQKVQALIRSTRGGKIEISMMPEMEVLRPLARGLKLDNLEEGQELGGVVKGIKPFGLFVDIGAEKDIVLSVRNINDGIVADVNGIIRRDDPILVKFVGRGAPVKGQDKLEFELVSPLPRLPAVDAFKPLEGKGEWLQGEVVKMTRPGWCLVALSSPDTDVVSAPVTAFMAKDDVTEIPAGPRGALDVLGTSVRVRVLKADVDKKQLFVSMQPLIEASAGRAAKADVYG